MDDRASLRAALVPRIAALTRTVDFRTSLSVRLSGQAQTIIVALPDDRMSYVFDRLRDAGGSGVVVVPTSEDNFDLARVWPASAERLIVAAEDDALAQVNEDVHVAMFITLLKSTGGPVVFERLAARLVDQGELQPA